MMPAIHKEGSGEQNKSDREQGVPIAPDALQKLKPENDQNEQVKGLDETATSEAAPSGLTETIEKPEISQEIRDKWPQ